jgi:hypothetical protein
MILIGVKNAKVKVVLQPLILNRILGLTTNRVRSATEIHALESLRQANAMTPEQIRIAVAEACEWKRHSIDVRGFSGALHKEHGWMSPLGCYQRANQNVPPNYPEDLNACHEMEKTLGIMTLPISHPLNRKWKLYESRLKRICERDGTFITHATAPQRCEAFLRTEDNL